MDKRALINRWFGPEARPIAIYDEASVSSAREQVREAGRQRGLSRNLIETASLIASELTHNHLRHAWQGYFAVRPIERGGIAGLEIIAGDLGPGIPLPSQAIGDAMLSDCSLGAGIAAVVRAADEIAFDNRLREGLCVVARKFETAPPPGGELAIMGRPYPGEAISGDDAAFFQTPAGFVCAVADGLGHGPEARQASHRAMTALADHLELKLAELVSTIHRELAGTRGCAMSILRYDRDERMIESASAGDVHSHLYHLRNARFFAATAFVVGGGEPSRPRIRVEQERVEPGSVLVVFTDGLKSRTSLKGQLDILRRPPIAIAEHLLETEARPDDDALVLVARLR